MHPPLLRSGAKEKKALNSAIRNSNRSRLKIPLGNCMASTYRNSQSTLPDTSDPYNYNDFDVQKFATAPVLAPFPTNGGKAFTFFVFIADIVAVNGKPSTRPSPALA